MGTITAYVVGAGVLLLDAAACEWIHKCADVWITPVASFGYYKAFQLYIMIIYLHGFTVK